MEENRKSTLVLLVFPDFRSPSDRTAFEGFLKTALVVTDADIRALEYQPRYTPLFVHAFLREQAAGWDGPLALVTFARGDSLENAVSKVGTIDQFVPGVRSARKVLVVGPALIREPYQLTDYPYTTDQGMVSKPLLIMREDLPFPNTAAVAIAGHVGTRHARRKDTATLLAAVPVERSRRDDESTQVGFPVKEPQTGRVISMRPAGDDEEERPTLEPPPPDIPFMPKR